MVVCCSWGWWFLIWLMEEETHVKTNNGSCFLAYDCIEKMVDFHRGFLTTSSLSEEVLSTSSPVDLRLAFLASLSS